VELILRLKNITSSDWGFPLIGSPMDTGAGGTSEVDDGRRLVLWYARGTPRFTRLATQGSFLSIRASLIQLENYFLDGDV
jgi:hypothetical protein